MIKSASTMRNCKSASTMRNCKSGSFTVTSRVKNKRGKSLVTGNKQGTESYILESTCTSATGHDGFLLPKHESYSNYSYCFIVCKGNTTTESVCVRGFE